MPVSVSKNASFWLLVFSQFAGTSLWFVGNAVVGSLPAVTPESYAALTSIVQGGFITGTLVFSAFGIADRFSSPGVFFISSLAAAVANLAIIGVSREFAFVLSLRFVTGFFLAGIYPVGMKIAADIFPERLGKVLGFLVGALVLGTAFPHLIRSQGARFGWKAVIVSASLLALAGGLLVLSFFPAARSQATKRSTGFFAAFASFRSKPFRSAAFGYFGHMWELYALWAVLPLLFTTYNQAHASSLATSFWSFVVIAAGSIGCVAGGLLSQKRGSKPVAFYSLLFSGACCLAAPLFFQLSETSFLALLVIWGITVTADSPQFSALVAGFSQAENKGTTLTLVTCIGFSITIISIQFLKSLFAHCGPYSLWALSIGPVLGLWALRRPGQPRP